MGNNVSHMNESFSNQNSPELDNLGRFIQAQNEVDNGYEQAKKEIGQGKKGSHWIWYIFPQIKTLGSSINAEKYGIVDFAEACNYLRNEALFQRYIELVLLVKKHLKSQVPLIKLMGVPDDKKLISSITLFHGIALFLQQQNPKGNYKDLADCCGEILNLASALNYPPCQATLDFLKISKERISKEHVNTVKSQPTSEVELEKRLIPETLIPEILEEPGFSNLLPTISGAIRGNNIELFQLLQRSEPHEFAKLKPDELLVNAISYSSMDLLEYILQNFKATMPNLLQYNINRLYSQASITGQMQALKYLEAIALKEGGLEKLSALRGYRAFEPFRFGAPNVQEYFLSDKTFFQALYSSGYFSEISFPWRYELLQKAKLSEQEILNEAAISGNLGYFDYLTQTKALLKHPEKANQAFLLAAEHIHLGLLQSLHKQIPLEQIKQIMVADNYQIITRLLNQQEDYGNYSSIGRASNPLIDKTSVLNWFQEIMPELKPKIQSIIQANQESKKIQIKGKKIIANLLATCEGYQVHLFNQNKETSKELLGKKINILTGLIKILRDSKVTDPTFKIEQFKSQLEQNINDLKKKRSPKWLQFIETIAHILSLALYSKLTKNTFQFWKSHGDLFTENAQEIIENKDSAPSKKM